MAKEEERPTKITVEAKTTKASKRYNKFVIETDEDIIVNSIYISKDIPIPKFLVIVLPS